MLRIVLSALLVLGAAFAPAAAQQDPLASFTDPIGDLQRLVPRVPDDRRADLILGRAVVAMDPPPAAGDDPGLIIPGDPLWDELSAWAAAPAQQAALSALREATERRDDRVFALPYGDAAPAELRDGGFAALLLEGKVYAADLAYLDGLAGVMELGWVEANRLAQAGEGADAMQTLVAVVRLGRLLADRPLYAEAMAGYMTMLGGLEGLRDLCWRHPEMLDERTAKRIIRELEDRTLSIDRLRFPEGDEIGVNQAVLDAFDRLGSLSEAGMEGVRRRTSEREEPMDQSLPSNHANYFETLDAVRNIYANWRLRWPLNPYDIVMARPSTYFGLDTTRLLFVAESVAPADTLFELRRELRSALAGTKLGIGVLAHREKFGEWPRPLFAIRPTFIREIDVDPYDPKQTGQMSYFVPIRDQEWGPRERPHPHTIRVQHAESPRVLARDLVTRLSAARFSDKQAYESVEAYVVALTEMGIEPRNVDETLEAMAPAELQRLVPGILKNRAEGLTGEELRTLALAMAKTALTAPDYPELRDRFGVGDTDGRGRRRQSRPRDQGEVALTEMRPVRALATAQARAGAPLIDRLKRITTPDSSITFTVELDESDFVIYSVGDDAVADWARESGIGGSDLLYWPSELTLLREAMGG